MLSDCHFDEIVDPAAIEGANCFNRAIALKRLERVLDRVHILTRDFYKGVTYDGAVLLLGGDLLSGDIHEELSETNEDAMLGSLDFWASQLTGFIEGLADLFTPLHIVGVVGNHGRTTRKPRHKRKVRSNLDWLLYRTVARQIRRDRVTWEISDASDTEVKIYSTSYRLTHGDQFHGGGGISGMMAPLMRGQHRKALRQMGLDKPFDWLVMGHWHQYLHGMGLIVNGALKGYDEYAYDHNFLSERAQQAFWLTTPEAGAAFRSPIFCDDRKSEGW